MYDLVSLGELMLRLEPPKYERLRRTTHLRVRACGAQFNVTADLAALGKRTALITKLPDNELGYLAQSLAAGYGVDTSHIQFVDGARIGMVFAEFSVSPRGYVHIYDRVESAASTISPEDFLWRDILNQARFVYLDGIFMALGPRCFAAALEFIESAREAGCVICFDVNYRESLWETGEAIRAYAQILPYVDILVTNRQVSEHVFKYKGEDRELLGSYQEEYGCDIVCLTYREMVGVLKGSWSSLALFKGHVVESTPVEFDVVDRFGTGDAFLAGFIYGYMETEDVQYSLSLGNALCALAHTTDGDVATFSIHEVRALIDDESTPTVRR